MEHTFYNIMKQNTCFRVNGGLCRDLLTKNLKYSFKSDHHHMIHAIFKTKCEKFESKKSIYSNFIQYDNEQFKFDIFNSMSAMRTHAAFENKFVSVLVKNMLLRK